MLPRLGDLSFPLPVEYRQSEDAGMPILRILKGEAQRDILIDELPLNIGRERTQDLRFPEKEVSRSHAQVVCEDDRYYLVDLRSHNYTYLNNRRLKPHTRYPLEHDDVIKICNYILVFLDPESSTWGDLGVDAGRETVDIVDGDPSRGSAVSRGLPSGSDSWEARLSSNPEAKLRAIMRLASELQKVVSLEEVLTRVLDSLLGLFPVAECAVIMFREENGRRIFPTLARHRDPARQDRATVSRTVIGQAMEEQRAILFENAQDHPDLKGHDSVFDGGLKSIMVAPVLDFDGRSLGAVQLDTRTRLHPFTEEDLDVLSIVVRMLSFVIEEARLRATMIEQRTLQRDLEVAREIQLGLLPNAAPDVKGYEFFDFYAPAKQVGGDYYDYLRLSDGRIAVVVGDVSGKGVPAAMLMAKLSSELRVYLASGLSPVEVLLRTNASYRDRAPEGSLVTLVLLILDPATHQLQIANAGHMRPLLVREGRPPENVGDDEAGCPLGVLPDPTYECCRLQLNEGDCLVLYSDGVTDATDEHGDMYELERLTGLLERSAGSAARLGQTVVDDVEKFVGQQPQVDDICLVCLNRKKAS